MSHVQTDVIVFSQLPSNEEFLLFVSKVQVLERDPFGFPNWRLQIPPASLPGSPKPILLKQNSQKTTFRELHLQSCICETTIAKATCSKSTVAKTTLADMEIAKTILETMIH